MTRNTILVAAIVAALGLGAGLWFALAPTSNDTGGTAALPGMPAPSPVSGDARPAGGSQPTTPAPAVDSTSTASNSGTTAATPAPTPSVTPTIDPAAGGTASGTSGTSGGSNATPPQLAPEPPSFDIVRVEKDGSTVIAGRAPAGSSVTLFDGDTPLGTVQAGRDGAFALVLDQPLAPGNRALSLAAKTADGTTVPSAGEVVVVVPDLTATAAASQPAATTTATESAATTASTGATTASASTGSDTAAATTGAATASTSDTSASGTAASESASTTAATETASTESSSTETASTGAAATASTESASTETASTETASTGTTSTETTATSEAAGTASTAVETTGTATASTEASGTTTGETSTAAATPAEATTAAAQTTATDTAAAAAELAGTQVAAVEPAAPAPAAPAPQPASPIVVASSPTGASVVMQVPGDLKGDTLRVEAVDYDLQGQVVVSGRAPAGTVVAIYLDDGLLGQSTSGANGRWVFTPSTPVAAGLHRLRADQLGADGSVTARAEIPFSRAETIQLAANEDFVVVQPGNCLWLIARAKYGDGFAYTQIYEANAQQIRDPDLIYPGQIFLVPKIN